MYTCLILFFSLSISCFEIDIENTKFNRFTHFWTSTGYCPSDPRRIKENLLSNETKIHLALIGALPNEGITHIRIHWLLNLLSIKKSDEQIKFDFSDMDYFLSILHKNGLYPGFEFMGIPRETLQLEKEFKFWSNICGTLANRYHGIYGKSISKWRFETWNEPDLKMYNIMNFNVSEYFDYVFGCGHGLKKSLELRNITYKFGGPAGLFKKLINHPLCWSLLNKCSQLERRCSINYLSFHRKGDGNAQEVINGTDELLNEIYSSYPSLRNLRVANDEADMETNWSKSLEWRGDARYAAMVVKVIAGYYKSVVVKRKLKIEVLSNDNAFLNYHPFYFTQRTLFARFQINNTNPPHSQFIKKPVYSLMALLSFLGDEIVQEERENPVADPLLTIIITRKRRGALGKESSVSNVKNLSFVSVMLAYGNETFVGNEKIIYELSVKGLGPGKWKYAVYGLSNIFTNPYRRWLELEQPVFPGKKERKAMREVEDPRIVQVPTTVASESLNISLVLTIPSIYLVHICQYSEQFPKKVISLAVYNLTWNEVLITWKYRSKYSQCLQTYEVEFQSKCPGIRKFKRINPRDTIFTSFHYAAEGGEPCENTRGEYKVRAVDYWQHPGNYSEIIPYP